jgi:WD40 repeat protein
MSEERAEPSGHEQQVNEVIAAYLLAREKGQEPDRADWLAQHADIAADLTAFLANVDQFGHFAEQLPPPLPAAPPPAEAAPRAPGETSPDPTPGRVRYFGDYELLEEIARGGMGVVFKARQVSLNRIVALKMILAGQLASPADVQRFRQEAENAANLDHPNIVPIYEIGEHDGQPYFSMKLIEGLSLATQMDKVRCEPRRAAQLLATVARAVHHAHQRGVLHRDLKPANILLASGGCEPPGKVPRGSHALLAGYVPHVTDFGLAKRVEGDNRLSQSGAIVGTPSYMAPEQAAAKKGLTVGVDVYSLGAVLYEMQTGRPPHQGETPLDVLLGVLEKEPATPRSLNPLLDRDLENICLKCLEKEPGLRYLSAEALADDLERWLRGEPIIARPAGRWKRLAKWVRRRPAAAAVVGVSALALVAVVALVAGFTWRLQEKNDDLEHTTEALTTRSEELTQSMGLLSKALTRATEAEGVARQREQDEGKARALSEQRLHLVRNTLLNMQLQRVSDLWASDPMAAGELLDDGEVCPFDLRDFSWGLYRSRCRRLAAAIAHQSEPIFVSSDGRTLVTRVSPHDVADGQGYKIVPASTRVWDLPAGTLRCQIDNGEPLKCSLNGQTVLLARNRSQLVLCSLVDGKELFSVDTKLELADKAVSAPDGVRIALRNDKECILWDLRRKVRHVLRGHQEGILQLAFFPDSSVLGTFDGNVVKLWEVQSGKERETPQHSVTYQLVFTADGKLVDMEKLQKKLGLVPVLSPDPRGIYPLVSPNGRYVVRPDGSDWYDVATERRLGGCPKEHAIRDRAVAFSADSRLLAVAETDQIYEGPQRTKGDGPTLSFRVRAFDVETGLQRWVLRDLPAFSTHMVFSPNSRWLCTSDGKAMRIWDTAPSLENDLEGMEATSHLAFTPDSRALVAGLGSLAIRDLSGAKQPRLLKADKPIWVVGLSADCKLAIVQDGETNTVWDVPANRKLRALAGNQISRTTLMSFSADGRLVAGLPWRNRYGDEEEKPGRWRVWDVNTGAVLLDETRLSSPPGNDLHFDFSWESTALAIAPDNRLLALAVRSRTNQLPALALVEVATRKVLTLFKEPTAAVTAVAFAPDGRTLAAATWRGGLLLWDVAERRLRWSVTAHPSGGIRHLAFAPDGQTLATCAGAEGSNWLTTRSEVKLWDAATGHLRANLPVPNAKGDMYRVAFAPDGRALAASGGWSELDHLLKTDKFYVRVWQIAGDAEWAVFPKAGSSFAVSPDGRWLAASSSLVQGVGVWDLTTGQRRFSFRSEQAVEGPVTLQFTPDNQGLLANQRIVARLHLNEWTFKEEWGSHLAKPAKGAVSVSPDQQTLALLGDNTVTLHNGREQKDQATLDVQADVVLFAPDGKTLAVQNAASVQLWDVASAKRLWDHRGSRLALKEFASDARTLAVAQQGTAGNDNALVLLDATSGKVRNRLSLGGDRANQVALSADGAEVAVVTDSQFLLVHETTSGRLLLRCPVRCNTIENHPFFNPLTQVRMTADGRTVFVAETEGTIRTWKVPGGPTGRVP